MLRSGLSDVVKPSKLDGSGCIGFRILSAGGVTKPWSPGSEANIRRP